MADIVTGTVTGQLDITSLMQDHSDIRREGAEHANEIVREGLKGDYATQAAIKDSRHDVATRINESSNALSQQVDAIDDTLTAQLFTISRESADNRAQLQALGYQVRDGFVAAAKDAEIQALKTQIETAKHTTYLSDKIDGQAEKTRELLNELKHHDLNRHLIERNAELVDERFGHRHWRGMWDQSQFQAVSNRLQALDSQFAETRQGMVNFGTMAGVGQTSTSNNVR